jgi:hypothetical protein
VFRLPLKNRTELSFPPIYGIKKGEIVKMAGSQVPDSVFTLEKKE